MKNINLFQTIIFVMLWAPLFAQTTIHIPDDYASIQEGIDEAQSGDTVLVAHGTYFENLNFKGKNIVLASHFLRDQYPAHIPQTIIDGSSKGPVVVFENGETSDAALIGFTIRGGAQDSLFTYGGGVICNNASPLISSNLIKGIYGITGDYGGAIVCINSGSRIVENIIDSIGIFFFNYAGAIVCYNSNLEISNNTLNRSYGGYVFRAGGGIVGVESDLIIHHNQITDMYGFDNINGGILLKNSSANIRHNTLFGNAQGLTLLDTSYVQLVSNIIYGNLPFSLGSIYEADSSSSIFADFNDIEGGWPGFGNIDQYPEFSDTSVLDLRLMENSPCIDAGNPWSFDPDGTVADMGAYYFHQESTSADNSTPLLNLKAYPNPAREKVLVELPANLTGTNTLLIYDMRGQLVESIENINKEQVNIHRNGLQSGVYFLQLKNGEKVIGSGKFIFE